MIVFAMCFPAEKVKWGGKFWFTESTVQLGLLFCYNYIKLKFEKNSL